MVDIEVKNIELLKLINMRFVWCYSLVHLFCKFTIEAMKLK